MTCHDHSGSALFRVVAAGVDDDLRGIRARLAAKMAAERERIATRRIVSEREQRVAASRAHDLVRKAIA